MSPRARNTHDAHWWRPRHRYGVEDVSTLSGDQMQMLRERQLESKRTQQEEDGALLRFLTQNHVDDVGGEPALAALSRPQAGAQDAHRSKSTPSLNRPLTWEEKEAIRLSDAEFAAQLATQQDASIDAFFNGAGASPRAVSNSADFAEFPTYFNDDTNDSPGKDGRGSTIEDGLQQ